MMRPTTIEQNLQQIVDMLILNGTLTECSGLIHGKMGIAIFFFHYAQFAGNMLFADYALDLISEMQSQIHANSSADYENGIAGIGVGIDYLIQNDFLITEEDICEDFDERMYRAVMYDPWQDFSMYDGLIGYGKYWMMRLRHQESARYARECLICITKRIEDNLSDIPTKEQADVYCFLHDLQKISCFDHCLVLLEQCLQWNLSSICVDRYFPRLSGSIVGDIIRLYQCNYYFNKTLYSNMNVALKQIPDLEMNKAPAGTGLLTGYAGEGLLRLATLDPTNVSWMQLL